MSATRKTLNGTSLREGTTQKRELVSRTHLSSRPSISPTAAAQVHVNKHESHVKTAMLLLLFVRFCTSFTPSPVLPPPIPLVPVPRSGLPCSLPSSLLRSRPLNLILFFSCSERHQRWLRQLSPIGDTTAPGRSHFGRPGFLGWRNAKPFARPASSLGAAMVCAVNPPYPSLGSALLRSPSFSSPRPFDSPPSPFRPLYALPSSGTPRRPHRSLCPDIYSLEWVRDLGEQNPRSIYTGPRYINSDL